MENLPSTRSTELSPLAQSEGLLPMEDLRARVALIHQVMKEVMKEGTHYGTIPGTQQPSLWKPGAEKIAMPFGISVSTEIVDSTVSDEEAFFHVLATATSQTGRVLGTARGICTTQEKKYRWRAPVHIKEWEHALPHMRRITFTKARPAYGNRPADPGGEEVLQVRTEPGDLIHTVLMMAQKRAFVAVVKQVTAASDIFVADGGDEGEDRSDRGLTRGQSKPGPAPTSKPTGPGLFVTDVKVAKKGQGSKGPWTLYVVRLSDGREGTTFSDSIADTAGESMSGQLPVRATLTEGNKPGKLEVKSLEILQPSGPPDDTSDEPPPEGEPVKPPPAPSAAKEPGDQPAAPAPVPETSTDEAEHPPVFEHLCATLTERNVTRKDLAAAIERAGLPPCDLKERKNLIQYGGEGMARILAEIRR